MEPWSCLISSEGGNGGTELWITREAGLTAETNMVEENNSKAGTPDGERLAVFTALKQILSPYKDLLAARIDKPGNCYLETRTAGLNGRRLFFAGAKIKKNYVSFYLTPLYMYPEIGYRISPSLRKSMQGQSCFNLKAIDKDCFDELSRLTEAAFQKVKNEHLL